MSRGTSGVLGFASGSLALGLLSFTSVESKNVWCCAVHRRCAMSPSCLLAASPTGTAPLVGPHAVHALMQRALRTNVGVLRALASRATRPTGLERSGGKKGM